MERTPEGMERYRMSLQSMRSWGDETFKTEEAKCLFGAFAPFVGHGPDDASGAEIAWLFASVLQAEGNKLVRGGMHQVSLALAAKLKALGGRIRTRSSAKRIEVDGTRATAVWLAEGERIETGLVASSVDPAQLALRLLGTEVIGNDAASRIRRLEWAIPSLSSTPRSTVRSSTRQVPSLAARLTFTCRRRRWVRSRPRQTSVEPAFCQRIR
jgi:phytoene dehydrogenase-like protein